MADDIYRNLLVVVCDINPVWWGLQARILQENQPANLPNEPVVPPLNAFLNNVLVFCNAHLMMKHTNELAILGATCTKSQFIYPSNEENDNDSIKNKDGKYEHFSSMNNIVVKRIREVMKNEINNDGSDVNQNTASLLSGALSMALCYIKQAERDCPRKMFFLSFSYISLNSFAFFVDFCCFLVGQCVKSRLLILKGTKDVSTQYMATMNCIFAAQKNNIVMDSCLLKSDSGFLQQWIFLPNPSTRESLNMPRAIEIDYRAACFCHRTLVDIGFVCSVCLSIYCQLIPRCRTCQTRFKLPMATLARPKKRKN
ncbi:general transcription factor IIH subunit 3-like isoform X2 [Xenia sp. Carnegie-2017]|uniref:general transcription factor IIH subunit 3-like isoform X2 n=1 Tax=Xenia sp. Carnegie-2017 TaxID=2897299 RepID=UPI001F03BA80|nr:general transcription factor IIH subunit 3-like isoform X2 [Xenia sp. Carnegie-2017]